MDDSEKLAQHVHRKDLTFRQGEGIDPLPKMLAHGELNKHLRHRIWDVLYSYFSSEINLSAYTGPAFKAEAFSCAILLARRAMGRPLDEAENLASEPEKFFAHVKSIVFSRPYYECLELLQLLLRSSARPNGRKGLVMKALDDPVSPYIVVDFPPLTIIPRGGESEAEAFKTNWVIIKASTFEGAKIHLRQSAEALNAGDASGAIREAIHAVESVACVITDDKKTTLGDALKTLKHEKGLHPALQNAFSALYGYTNIEKGIRHALIDGGNDNVGQDEALFMFSACTAFVGYLARKFPDKA